MNEYLRLLKLQCPALSIVFLEIRLVSRFEAVDDEGRVEEKGQCGGDHGVHDQVELDFLVPVGPKPRQHLRLVQQIVCKK